MYTIPKVLYAVWLVGWLVGTNLFVKVPRPEDSEVTATCYYQSNHSKVEAIPLSALPKDITSELWHVIPRDIKQATSNMKK